MAAKVAAASLLPPMSPAAPKLNDDVGIVVDVGLDADVAVVGTRTAGAVRIIIQPRATSNLRRPNKLSSSTQRSNSPATLEKSRPTVSASSTQQPTSPRSTSG